MLRKLLNSGIKNSIHYESKHIYNRRLSLQTTLTQGLFSRYRTMSTSVKPDISPIRLQIRDSEFGIFFSNGQWSSYSGDIRDDLSKCFKVIDSFDNDHGIKDKIYDHFAELIKDGYFNFDKFVHMSKDSRRALMNLIWHSSFAETTGGTWALKQKLFTIDEFLTLPKACREYLVQILREAPEHDEVIKKMTEDQKIELIKSYLHDYKILNDIKKVIDIRKNIENQSIPTFKDKNIENQSIPTFKEFDKRSDTKLTGLALATVDHIKDTISYLMSKLSPRGQEEIRLLLKESQGKDKDTVSTFAHKKSNR